MTAGARVGRAVTLAMVLSAPYRDVVGGWHVEAARAGQLPQQILAARRRGDRVDQFGDEDFAFTCGDEISE